MMACSDGSGSRGPSSPDAMASSITAAICSYRCLSPRLEIPLKSGIRPP